MADTLIAGDADGLTNETEYGVFGPYWLNDLTGVIIFVASSNDITARYTDDGNATSSASVAEAGDVSTFACWYDQETPGDTGSLVHVAWFDPLLNAERYANFNLSTGAWSTPVDVATVDLGAGHNAFLTKTRSGDLIFGCINTTGATSGVWRSTDGGATWAAIANPWEGDQDDQAFGATCNTGDGNDAAIVFWDASADEISVKVYDQSADGWTETAVASSMADELNLIQNAVATRRSDGHALLAAWNLLDNVAADLMTWDLNIDSVASPTVTAKGNIVTNSDDCVCVGLAVDPATDDVYAAYLGDEDGSQTYVAVLDVFYKKSTDGMATWGSQTAMSEAADDLRAVHGGVIGVGGGRWQPCWFNDDLLDIFVNLTNDIEFAVSGDIAITLEAIVVDVVLPAPTADVPRAITLEAIVVDVVLPAPAITGISTLITLEAIVVDVVLPAPAVDLPRTFTLDAIVVDVDLPAPAVDLPIGVTLEAIVVDVVLVDHQVIQPTEVMEGFTGAIITRPGGVAVTNLGGAILHVIHWETRRALNSIGTWSATISAAEPSIAGTPLADSITRGWELSLIQENTHPLDRLDLEYLLYRGVIEDKKYSIDESGQAVCELSGSFRGIHLAARSTPTAATYTAQTISAAASDIEGSIAGGITVPTGPGAKIITLQFNDAEGAGILSRYARLLRLGEFGRLALRETWESDALEFISIDAAPDSGYYLVNQEAADPSQSLAAQAGFALIGGTPSIRREGRGIVNRIIAFGEDTTADGRAPLPLSYSTRTTPYAVKYGTNPDLTSYAYLEDTASIAAHGLVELALHRSDIANPSDDTDTRRAAANVLHAVASGELLKYKSPKVFVEIPVANGPHVWALPGDKITLQYTGYVEVADGVLIWQSFDRVFLVIERRDAASPSGVRVVSFTLAAPETEIPIPALPGEVVLPITESGSEYGDIDGLTDGLFEDCCDDPTTDVEDGDTEPPEIEEAAAVPVSSMLMYLQDGSDALMVAIEGGSEDNEWAQVATNPGGSVTINGPLFGLGPDEAAFRLATVGGGGYLAGEYTGTGVISLDGGVTWNEATPPGNIGGSSPGPYEQFYSAIKRGGIYSPFAYDNSGANPGDAWRLFYSEDGGATWQYYVGLTFVSIIPHQIEEHPTDPGVFAILGHGHSVTPPATEEMYMTVFAPGYLGTWDSAPTTTKTKLRDFDALFTWGNGDRFIIAARTGTDESVILTWDYTDLFDIPQGTEVTAYSGGNLGRAIGIVRKEGTDIVFAAFEDGTVLRSTTNGSSWAAMSVGAEFYIATSLAYDQEQDYLWVGGRAPNALNQRALLHVWAEASTTSEESVDATRNLNDLTGLNVLRGPGHLGMIVFPGPQPRIVNLEAIVVDVVLPDPVKTQPGVIDLLPIVVDVVLPALVKS